MNVIQFLWRAIPEKWKPTIQKKRIRFNRIRYRVMGQLLQKNRSKHVYRCPCCGTVAPFTAGSFISHPELYDDRRYRNISQDVLCPVCRSLPRHRILALWCERHLELLKRSDILYFAQEYSMELWMRENGVSCVTADLNQPADRKMDIQQTGLPNECFDVVFCNHVLEHVEDYRKALRELYRILRSDGVLICSFPMDPEIDEVEEESAPLSREERIRRFGQYDHNRVFGRSADRLLTGIGFTVERISGDAYPAEILPVVGPADYDANVLFCCRKPSAANAPLVSVIVPVYNVRPYLGQCVRSILGQSYPRFELILVDDGSTDGSGELCDRWGERDSRVRVIHQENRGLSGARNTGLEHMRGEYVCFVDSDDYVHRDLLRRLLNRARAENADIVCCGLAEVLSSGSIHRNIISEPCVCSGVEAMERLFRMKMLAIAWGKLYRREIWDALRFPEGRVYEDIATAYHALYKCEKCVICPEILFFHRLSRLGSITNELSWENEQDHILALKEAKTFVAARLPELSPVVAHWVEIKSISDYLRMAQPEAECPTEDLERIRRFVLDHTADLLPPETENSLALHRVALLLIRYCPGLAALAYRARFKLRQI